MVNLHHLGERLQAVLTDDVSRSKLLRFSPEPSLLGTGGGIRRMATQMESRSALVMNAKLVMELDIDDLLNFHRRTGSLATLVVRPHPFAERWGAIGVDSKGRIGSILEVKAPQSPSAQSPIHSYMFTGIHLIEPELVQYIPDGPSCIIRDTYLKLLQQGAPLFAYHQSGYFYEHSTPARYLQGNFNLLERSVPLSFQPGPLSGIDPFAQIDPSATITPPVLLGPHSIVSANARIGPNVILGSHAKVIQETILSHSIVWAHTQVTQSATRAIVTPQQFLRVPQDDAPEASPR